MNNIEVKDNLLSPTDFENIQQNILNSPFPWYLTYIATDSELSTSLIYNYQFCHHFIGVVTEHPFTERSSLLKFIYPIAEHIPSDAWVRIKANMVPRTESIVKHGFHIDHDDERMKASIFYLNTNDGYTEFEDGTKIESIGNRLVTFPTNLKHTGTTCTDNPFRVVINFNYF